MKHILTSVDAIFDSKTNKPFPGIFEQLNNFKNKGGGREVVIISARGNFLDQIPDRLNPIRIPFKLRGTGKNLADYLSCRIGVSLNDIIIIGSKDPDMQTANHLKSILLRAEYALHNNPKESIFTKEYGIPMEHVSSIGYFFDSFDSIQNPWHFRVQVDEDTTFLSLTSANTFNEAGNSVKIKDEFREYLKKHKTEYVIPFTSYFIVSSHLMMKELSAFDFWDIYPSSGKGVINEDLVHFAKKAAHTFGKRFNEQRIFIRTENCTPRHFKTHEARIITGCDDQFKTMIINPYYKERLENRNVCIIDDFTRHGTSCETARYMLKKAGVNKILFISMGKFGSANIYNKYDYVLGGDVYSGLKYRQTGREMLSGDINPIATKDFIKSLGGIV